MFEKLCKEDLYEDKCLFVQSCFFKSDYLDDSGFASRNLICVHTNTPEKVNTMGYDQVLS